MEDILENREEECRNRSCDIIHHRLEDVEYTK